MKTQNKITTILSVACLAMIGTGYALWQFSKDAEAETTSNVIITDMTETGTLTVNSDTFYLTVDQNFLGWSDGSGNNVNSIELVYSGAEETNETVKFTCEITNNVNSYINITDGSFNVNNVNYTGDDVIVTYTLPEVSWIDNKKPTNKTEYNTMKSTIESEAVVFSFVAEIE